MKRIFTAILCVIIALTGISCSKDETRVIKVYGTGEVTYVPDYVTMTVTVKDVKPVLKDAVANTNSTTKKLLELCKQYEVADADVKTSYCQTGKEYEWSGNKQEFKGYKSEQTLNVTFRELDKIEKFTGDILALQVYSLGNFKYGHSKKSEYDAEANLLALDDAKTAASKMAERMGVKAGDVLYISDVDDEGPYSTADYDRVSLNKSLNYDSGFVVSSGILVTRKVVVVSFKIK